MLCFCRRDYNIAYTMLWFVENNVEELFIAPLVRNPEGLFLSNDGR